MNRSNIVMVLATASMLAMGAALPAHAQDAQDAQDVAASEDSSGEILVTARRVEERLQDVPISISVFSQEQLSRRDIVNAGDLAIYTPSLSTNSRFGPEKTSFAIRGFVQEGGSAPSVGVYFAEVAGARTAATTPGGNGAGPGTFFDLQNVQVLKGPQGTLFGRNTTGGAVLVVPRKPTDRLEGYVEGSLGSYDMRRAQAVLNVPLSDTFRVRLGVDRMVRDGYLVNRDPRGRAGLGNVNYWAARASIVGDLTPDLENYMVLSYSKSNTSGLAMRIAACNTASASAYAIGACAQMARQNARGGYYDVESSLPDQHQTMEQWQVINTTTWTANDSLTVKNIASYTEYRENLTINSFGLSDIPYGPANVPTGIVYVYDVPGFDNIAQSSFTEELQLQGRGMDGKLNWQAGGYLEMGNPLGYGAQQTVNALYCTSVDNLTCADPTFNGRASSLQYTRNKTTFRTYGLYGQATYRISDKLAMTAGIRYTWDKSWGVSEILTLAFPKGSVPGAPTAFACADPSVTATPTSFGDISACSSLATAQSSRPTWLIDLEYKPTEDILLYAKYSRGYRTGGFSASQPIAVRSWGPEKVDNYELGLKTSFDGVVRGYFNIAAYYADFTNQQIQINVIPPAPFTPAAIIQNAGKSRMMGMEVDASLTFVRGLQFDLGYAYLDTRLQQVTDPVLPAGYSISGRPVVGNPLTLSPAHKLTISGTYTLPLDASLGHISVGATYSYTSEQFASHGDTAFAGTAGVTYANFTTVNPGLIPSIQLLNLNANWDSVVGLPIDLAVFVTNLTQTKYPINTFAGLAAFGFSAQVVGPPRMFGARFKYRF